MRSPSAFISFSEEKKARHAVNCVTQDYKKDGVT